MLTHSSSSRKAVTAGGRGSAGNSMIPTLVQQRTNGASAVTAGVPTSSKQRSASSSSSSSHRPTHGDGKQGLGRATTDDDDPAETSLVLAGAALGVGESGDAWGAQAMQTMHQIVSSGALLAEREAALRQREEAIQVGWLGEDFSSNTSSRAHSLSRYILSILIVDLMLLPTKGARVTCYRRSL